MYSLNAAYLIIRFQKSKWKWFCKEWLCSKYSDCWLYTDLNYVFLRLSIAERALKKEKYLNKSEHGIPNSEEVNSKKLHDDLNMSAHVMVPASSDVCEQKQNNCRLQTRRCFGLVSLVIFMCWESRWTYSWQIYHNN